MAFGDGGINMLIDDSLEFGITAGVSYVERYCWIRGCSKEASNKLSIKTPNYENIVWLCFHHDMEFLRTFIFAADEVFFARLSDPHLLRT